jgi:hypothetical protein
MVTKGFELASAVMDLSFQPKLNLLSAEVAHFFLRSQFKALQHNFHHPFF